MKALLQHLVRAALSTLLLTLGAAAQDARPASAEPPKAALHGKVIGDGPANARITVYHSLGLTGTVEAVAGGVADRDGAFAMRDVPWLGAGAWALDSVVVTAQAGDRVGLLQIRSAGEDARVEIELRRTCRIRGVVRDERSGEPIAGASVWPMIFGDPETARPVVWATEPLLPWHARTDAEGRFELVGVPAFTGYMLDVSGPAHARRLVRVEDPSRSTEVRLVAGGGIVGDVRHADGKPAAGVTVWASGGDGFARTRTDARGRFQFVSLSAESYSVSTIAADGPRVVATHVWVRPGATVNDVDLQFVDTGVVLGALIDAATGERIAGGALGSVAVGPESAGLRVDSSAHCAADGSFRIEVAPGRNRLTVCLPGWSADVAFVDVRAGQEVRCDVRMQRGEAPRRR